MDPGSRKCERLALRDFYDIINDREKRLQWHLIHTPWLNKQKLNEALDEEDTQIRCCEQYYKSQQNNVMIKQEDIQDDNVNESQPTYIQSQSQMNDKVSKFEETKQ